jgi:diguanylate cyclase (GGDEF)-like protein
MVSKHNALRVVVPPDLRDWVDNRLISAHIRICGTMVLLTLANAALVTIGLLGHAAAIEVALFAVLALGAGLHRQWLAAGIARSRRQKRPEKMHRAFFLNSLWLGSVFGMVAAALLPALPDAAQLLLAICIVGQIATAAYTVRTLPRSAEAFILAQTLGLAVGLARLGTPEALSGIAVLTIASGLLIRMTHTAHDLFVKRILADRDLAAAGRTVKLLLNEFEESGSDWLFEVDGDGRLINVSPRFAAAAGRTVAALERTGLIDLFVDDHNRQMLEKALASRQSLRDHVLELAAAPGRDERTWWSIAGRPCYRSTGDTVAYRGVISDITGQRLVEDRVRHMAHYDALTGLPNRTLLNQRLSELLDDRPIPANVALLLVDVDRFKAINDMYGHPVGDALLRKVAERLTTIIADSGLGGEQRLVARLGGDEFAILISGDSVCDPAVRLAELLVAEMPEAIVLDSHQINAAVNIGIALAPHHAEIKQQLLSKADVARDAAKRNGRGTWEMFEPGMDAELHERHELARDLRHAAGNGELRLFIQPLVEIHSEAKTGYEALLRWQHPTRGMVGPDVFIPIAEETGLIVPIGEWVIRTALNEAAGWAGNETIAINLSPVQLESLGLLPVIVQALAESGLDPARVEFEVTENVLLHHSASAIETLNRLHQLGVKIALDDFGTGYASLNYLLTFPFDKIKIDRRFISELATREESRVIVGAVIALANELGMCTLAEGVEEADQLERLREHGCRMVQGWLFGKAMPSEVYQPRIASRPAAPEAARLPRKRRALSTQTYSRARRA